LEQYFCTNAPTPSPPKPLPTPILPTPARPTPAIPTPSPDPFPPSMLRCEYLEMPMALNTLKPRFSWRIGHKTRGHLQSAYQVLVSAVDSSAEEGDAWDSGIVQSNYTSQIEYSGGVLNSRSQYFWRVRWRDDHNWSMFSAVALFETGLPSDEWRADWVSGATMGINQLRHEFQLPSMRDTWPPKSGVNEQQEGRGSVLSAEQRRRLHGPIGDGSSTTTSTRSSKNGWEARVYISGIGYYELTINGHKVSDDVLAPGWTTYSARTLYSAYDITSLLRPGSSNAIGVMLGNGPWGRWWKRPPQVRLELHARHMSSKTDVIVRSGTDDWHCRAGPVTADDIYYGEAYDARKEEAHWDEPNFPMSADWTPVVKPPPITGGGSGESWTPAGPPVMTAVSFPPQRVVRTMWPRNMSSPRPHTFVFDVGQNIAGWVRLRLPPNKRGTTVRVCNKPACPHQPACPRQPAYHLVSCIISPRLTAPSVVLGAVCRSSWCGRQH
jgi:alpha-L-rhamnosidase